IYVFVTSPRHPPSPALFPYTTLFRSRASIRAMGPGAMLDGGGALVSDAISRLTSSMASARADWPEMPRAAASMAAMTRGPSLLRSAEHTSELQSRENLVCRLLLEKEK